MNNDFCCLVPPILKCQFNELLRFTYAYPTTFNQFFAFFLKKAHFNFNCTEKIHKYIKTKHKNHCVEETSSATTHKYSKILECYWHIFLKWTFIYEGARDTVWNGTFYINNLSFSLNFRFIVHHTKVI